MLMEIADIIILLFGIAGSVLLGKKDKRGFICFIIHSTATVLVGISAQYWGLVSTSALFIVIDIYYYIQWSKEEKK